MDRTRLVSALMCSVLLAACACSSGGESRTVAADAGADGANTGGGPASGTGGTAGTGGRGASTGGATVGSGGSTTSSGGRDGSGGRGTGGASTGGASTGGAGTGGSPQNAVCASADGNGFFADCSACIDPSNCDTIDVGGGARRSCGCSGSGDCPCGLSCGCITLAPGVRSCGICTR